MSAKITQRITRSRALEILTDEIEHIGNDVLGNLLDVIAESEQSKHMCRLDNFLVTDFNCEPGDY